MKLVNSFTLWYLVITFAVLLLGIVIIFYSVQREIDREAVNRLSTDINKTIDLVEQGNPIDQIESQYTTVKLLPQNSRETKLKITKIERDHDLELKISQTKKIRNSYYKLTARDLTAEPDEIAAGAIISISWVFGILLLIMIFFNRLISKRILSPFHKTLQQIQSFNLKQETPLLLDRAKTVEFQNLNSFLIRMTKKAVDDYKSLKEFTENASHELQTPLAIIRGKLELMMDSDLTDLQSRQVIAIYSAVERLNKINHSLILLAKLEYGEYDSKEKTNLSVLIINILKNYDELLQMKSLTLNADISPDVFINLGPAMSDILVSNLLSNAIKHNVKDGKIDLRLTSSLLTITNTGEEPHLPISELFKRFKKTNKNLDSPGLGLSIIKQICDVNQLGLNYTYHQGWHQVKINIHHQ